MGARGESSTPRGHKGDTREAQARRLWDRWDQGLKAFVSRPSGISQMPCMCVKLELALGLGGLQVFYSPSIVS